MNPPIKQPEGDHRPHTPRKGLGVLGARETLDHLRQKMEDVAADFAAGRLNRAQFNAMYNHYNEQRVLVERLHQRNPDNDTWRQAARPGHTGFLRSHFEAQPIFYVVFRHREPRPLNLGGTEPADAKRQVTSILKAMWAAEKLPTTGLARKAMGDGQWMVVALGEHAVTIVIFSLQPSINQQDLVRDLHRDFERANRLNFQRNLSSEKMVFPQRSLIS